MKATVTEIRTVNDLVTGIRDTLGPTVSDPEALRGYLASHGFESRKANEFSDLSETHYVLGNMRVAFAGTHFYRDADGSEPGEQLVVMDVAHSGDKLSRGRYHLFDNIKGRNHMSAEGFDAAA